MEPIRLKILREDARVPTYGSEEAAGADLYACLSDSVTIAPGESLLIQTGIAIELPRGFAGLICARSGMATKRGLAPANKVGVIDSDYRGEICVVLHNHGTIDQKILHGDRIAQLLITPVCTPGFETVDKLSDTRRANNGFGSTGK